MKQTCRLLAILIAGVTMHAWAQHVFESDVISTSAGNLNITFIGHASLIFGFGGKIIHVDPFSKLADYTPLPKADGIFITHEHFDHLDPMAIRAIRTPQTVVVMSSSCAGKLEGGLVMTNGEHRTVLDIPVEAIPAYNLVHMREDGRPYHPKGAGNGYIFTFGNTRVYVAGDTENISEMKALTHIDVAFLPMNVPYTMTPEMVANAARAFNPGILYPYHYSESNPQDLLDLMKGVQGVEIRIRKMR